jgi:hypothetical protein
MFCVTPGALPTGAKLWSEAVCAFYLSVSPNFFNSYLRAATSARQRGSSSAGTLAFVSR